VGEQVSEVFEKGEKPANFVLVASAVKGPGRHGDKCKERHRDKWDAIQSFYN